MRQGEWSKQGLAPMAFQRVRALPAFSCLQESLPVLAFPDQPLPGFRGVAESVVLQSKGLWGLTCELAS